ncbi:Biotin carboxyl carrier protein of acetyl-CoA carboxylase 1 chloroplastic [Bienertia sinuspersici]
MAISLPSSSSSAISEIPTYNFLAFQQNNHHSFPKVSLSLIPKLKLGVLSKIRSSRNVAVKAKLKEVALDGSNNVPPTTQAKSGLPSRETKIDDSATESSLSVVTSEESVSEFLSQVASLVKLVDSRDIAELQLKQLDCEILIRKKEAVPLPQAPNLTPAVTMQSPPPAAPSPTPLSSLPTPAPASSAPVPVAKSAKPSHPPLKSPMSGTFYRSPAPGEPPFVKVGDKVQKGQVICIIEAMKLMNEIEADQSGTVVEILAEDAKPISIDSPLLVIQP